MRHHGPESFNRELGLKRAGYVKTFLVNAGINADQIMDVIQGFIEPAAPNNTPKGEPQTEELI